MVAVPPRVVVPVPAVDSVIDEAVTVDENVTPEALDILIEPRDRVPAA